jgi:hypothetical protein
MIGYKRVTTEEELRRKDLFLLVRRTPLFELLLRWNIY